MHFNNFQLFHINNFRLCKTDSYNSPRVANSRKLVRVGKNNSLQKYGCLSLIFGALVKKHWGVENNILGRLCMRRYGLGAKWPAPIYFIPYDMSMVLNSLITPWCWFSDFENLHFILYLLEIEDWQVVLNEPDIKVEYHIITKWLTSHQNNI